MAADPSAAGALARSIDKDRDTVDCRERGTEQRVERDRGRKRGPRKCDRARTRPHARPDCDRNRKQAERAGRRVLRRVPHGARQVVDSQALERPRRNRVDVELAQHGERLSAADQIDDGRQPLRARGDGRQHHGERDRERMRGHGSPRREIDRRDEEQRGAKGVQFERLFHISIRQLASVAGTRK